MHMDEKQAEMTEKHSDIGNGIKLKHSEIVNTETKSDLQSTKGDITSKQQSGIFQKHMLLIATVRNYGLLVIFLAYYSYAMYCNFGDEGSIRLTVFTGFGILYLSWGKLLSQEGIRKSWKSVTRSIYMSYKYGARRRIIKWILYLVWAALLIYYLIANVALKDPGRLRSLGGFLAFILILVMVSNNRRKINWHCVFWGSAMQCILGYVVIKTTAGKAVILWFSDRLTEFMDYSRVGVKFAFGDSYMDHRFAMQTMPSIIVFFAAIQVLIYLGTIQFIVRTLGTFLAVILDVSAPEATNACANIFLGGIEAAILVIEYIDSMPTSRLFTLMTNWFASCGGSALIQFVSFGVPASYLLAASAMSAPAALVCAKIVFPDVDQTAFKNNIEEIGLEVVTKESEISHDQSDHMNSGVDKETSVPAKIAEAKDNDTKEIVDNRTRNNTRLKAPKSIGEALVVGTKQGIKLISNILGNIIVALSVVEFLDKTVEWFGDRVNIHITLKLILSYVFYPFVYMMGVDKEDCLRAGEMLGIRTISAVGISYQELGELIKNRETLMDYSATFNENITYERDHDIFLPKWNQTLVGGVFSESSEYIVSYALCGFASLPMIGMTLGALAVIIPDRAPEITKLAFRALLAGTMASYLTACVAGRYRRMLSNPCQNGATCHNNQNSYSCTCAGGWQGYDCDIDIDECASNPCFNGATCNNLLNHYTCTCAGGWQGYDCDQDIDECASNPCQNGATCNNLLDLYTCDCAGGWQGYDCDIDIDECASNPCQNGATCNNLLNHYTCTCAGGWQGYDCDIDIDECASNPCYNGATCNNLLDQYTCDCTGGWQGYDCDVDIDECLSSPCINGTCSNLQNAYMCTCFPQYTARNCDYLIGSPMDGQWGLWEAWQGCSATCGTGRQRRYRACDDPPPDYGGLPCVGDGFDETSCSGGSACPVVVDGNWGAWTTVSSCSATCGQGKSLKTRQCDNPPPSNGGNVCSGDAAVLSTCIVANCTASASNSNSGAYVNVCPTGYFSCYAGRLTCIQEIFRCDCFHDCDDGSDENDVWAGCSVICPDNDSPGLHSLSLATVLLVTLSVSFLRTLF